MNGIEKFANLDKKFAWSFLGFVLAVFFGGLTIYNEFIKVRDPQMVLEVLSDTNVLDLRENLPELKILYGDVDIKSVGKDLSIIVFRVKNVGGASILGGFYDANSPVTINLSKGDFLKFEKIGASNEYLENSAVAKRATSSSIQMPNVILEPGESYTIKALVIHEARTATSLKSSGKVAGMREIPVLKIDSEKDTESFWSQVFSGSIGIQALRLPIYFSAFIFGMFILIAPVIGISELFEKKGRQKAISHFRKHVNDVMPEGHEKLFSTYTIFGLAPLVHARELLSDTEKLKIEMERYEERHKPIANNGNTRIEGSSHDQIDFDENSRNRNRRFATRIIKDAAIAKIDQNGEIQIESQSERFLGKFIDYITIKES